MIRISNSQLQTFKQCRRLWELQYKYGLRSTQIAPALETGLTYHDKVESIIRDGWFEMDDDPVTNAMALAFKRYIYPFLSDKFQPEVWFEHKTPCGNLLTGRYDGKGERMLLEHKTTSNRVDGSYWAALELDEQIMTYMMASGLRTVFYTVCQKPKLRQSKCETDVDFQKRCCDWFKIDTDSKIGYQIITRTDDEIKAFQDDVDMMCNEIDGCSNFYRNPNHCMRWGRPCEFMSICKHYDPNQTYVGFERKDDR